MPNYRLNDVTIRVFPAVRVAVMRHRGDPCLLPDTIQRFIEWRRATRHGREVSATYTIFHSDPRTTPPADFRLDLCAASSDAIGPNDAGVEPGIIPAGRCGALRIIGESENLESAALFLFQTWLPSSGEEPRDFPLFCHRVSFFPDVPQNEAVTDLFLPIV